MFLLEPIESAPAGLCWTVIVVCLMAGTLLGALSYRDEGDDL